MVTIADLPFYLSNPNACCPDKRFTERYWGNLTDKDSNINLSLTLLHVA